MGTEKRERKRVEDTRRNPEANTLAVVVFLERVCGCGGGGSNLLAAGLQASLGGGAKTQKGRLAQNALERDDLAVNSNVGEVLVESSNMCLGVAGRLVEGRNKTGA
jgi:hypothetical protein